jgi:hypothetical protein
MSIPNYIRPQLTIRQLLDTTASAALDRLNPLVVGPNYHVKPYSATPSGTGTPYLTAGVTVEFPDADVSEVLDAASVRVFAKALDLAHSSGTGTIPSLADSNIVQLTGTTVEDEQLQIGDIFISSHVSADGFRRTITGFLGEDIAADYDQDGEAASNPLAVGANTVVESPAHADFLPSVTGTFAGLVKGPMYNGYYGDLITLTCTTGGAPGTAVVSIRTATGLYNADNVPTTDSSGLYAITGYFDGLTLKLTKQGAVRNLVIGDVITFQVKAPYALLSTSVLAITGTYTGPSDTTYLIKVTTGGAIGDAVIQVTDTAGIDVVQTHTGMASAVAELCGTYGLSFTFTAPDGSLQGGLRKGDVYAVSCVAASKSTTVFDKVVLSGPAIDITNLADGAVTGWTSRIAYTGEILPKNTDTGIKTWTADTVAGGVVFAATAKLGVARATGTEYFSLVNNTGELFPSYRALVPPAAGEGLLTITPENISVLGDVALDNTLAYGVNRALAGAQGKAVYALRTGGLTASDFTAALNKVRNTDRTYALAILSDNLAVKQAAGTHVDAMSAEAVKNFRRAYVGTDTPGVYGAMLKQSDNTNFTATVIAYNGGNKKVYCAAGGFLAATVGAGDLFRTNFSVDSWGDSTYEEYVVASVLSDTELALVSGPTAPVNPAAKFEVWKADTAANQVSYLSQVSAAIASRRVANVWADQGTALVDGAITVIPSMFLAAEIAGLRCALYPQQSLTNTEIATITAAANMYLKYSAADLDAISAAGVFVVTQDIDGGAVYIRHQITTKVSSGSLYYEDSVGVNLDAISFAVKDILQGYIGKRNANSQTINEINKKLTLLLDKQVLTSPSVDVGPALSATARSPLLSMPS